MNFQGELSNIIPEPIPEFSEDYTRAVLAAEEEYNEIKEAIKNAVLHNKFVEKESRKYVSIFFESYILNSSYIFDIDIKTTKRTLFHEATFRMNKYFKIKNQDVHDGYISIIKRLSINDNIDIVEIVQCHRGEEILYFDPFIGVTNMVGISEGNTIVGLRCSTNF